MYSKITEKISDKKAQGEIRRLFDEAKPEGMLEYIKIYATSVENPDEKDKQSRHARELYQYLDNNRNGLLPYNRQGITIPEPQEGIIYKEWAHRKVRTVRDNASHENAECAGR